MGTLDPHGPHPQESEKMAPLQIPKLSQQWKSILWLDVHIDGLRCSPPRAGPTVPHTPGGDACGRGELPSSLPAAEDHQPSLCSQNDYGKRPSPAALAM